MSGRNGSATGLLQHKFLWLLVGAYALAGAAPDAGRWLSGLAGPVDLFGYGVRASAPAVMLGVMLFAAGLAVKGDHLRGVFRRPATLVPRF